MNAERRWQGQADPPLSPLGCEQARALAERLADEPFDALYASDLERAHATARALGARLGLAVASHEGLRELGVGAWSGLLHAEILERWPDQYARFRAGDLDVRPGGGESRRELAVRARATLRELIAAWPGGRIAVVTHGGLLRSFAPDLRLANTDGFWLGADLSGPVKPLDPSG
jgi:broad specificity phosphatase PhoE